MMTSAAVTLAAAQDHAGHSAAPATPMSMSMPMYDKATEVTVRGLVESVVEMDHAQMMAKCAEHCAAMQMPMGRGQSMPMPMGPMGMTTGITGIHVMLKSDTGIVEVHVGPAMFLKERNLTLAQGDRLEVVGSKMTMGATVALIARQVTKNGATVAVRDESGRPLWRQAAEPH